MGNPLLEFQRDIVDSLVRTSKDFFKVGTEAFHNERTVGGGDFHVAVGNISIASEQLMKAFLASHSLSLLFSNLDAVTQAVLTCPTSIPSEINCDLLVRRLKMDQLSTIKFDRTFDLVFALLPDLKPALLGYDKLMVKARNGALHFIQPTCDVYSAEIVAFAGLSLASRIGNIDDRFGAYYLTRADRILLEAFSRNRANRVMDCVERAKNRARKLVGPVSVGECEGDWEALAIPCVVCKNSAIAHGETEFRAEQVAEGEWESWLVLVVDGIHCRNCGLKLSTPLDMASAGFAREYERPEGTSDWFAQDYE